MGIDHELGIQRDLSMQRKADAATDRVGCAARASKRKVHDSARRLSLTGGHDVPCLMGELQDVSAGPVDDCVDLSLGEPVDGDIAVLGLDEGLSPIRALMDALGLAHFD